MPRFKSTILYRNIPKVKLFLQKNAKFSSAGGSDPRVSGGRGLSPQTLKTAPHCEFVAIRRHYTQW